MNVKDTGNYWDELYASEPVGRISADGWLNRFEKLILSRGGAVLDLGCGRGGDTAFFLGLGKSVVACDSSAVAVDRIRKNFPGAHALCFDMLDGLPFPDGSFGTVCADLSLHYFTAADTRRVLGEIERVLTPEGCLLVRVNSVNDLNYGAGQGEETEHHLYRMPDGRLKRFFDREDIERLFSAFCIDFCAEEKTDCYGAEKSLFCLCLSRKAP